MTDSPRRGMFILAAVPAVALIAGGCSSSPSGPTGGPVMGDLDTHCKDADGGVMATPIGICMPVGTGNPDGGAVSEYGPTLYNAEGDDDDCKYHVKWTATPIRENTDVAFTVTLTKLADMSPAIGAGINAEVYLNDTHPGPPPPQAMESSGGVYKVSPIKFDMPGDWTVRFHFFEDCADAPADSPHGHAAFFVHVP